MAGAVEPAEPGQGATSPNPVVGRVVPDSGANLAGGFHTCHAFHGGPHAEVAALSRADERARGGTAYVTLEPRDHTGSTDPCTQALLGGGRAASGAAGVAAVADRLVFEDLSPIGPDLRVVARPEPPKES
jgi:diaminohydroxyphosphoribosylaminopyrimidine deaminase / 5-amino-6-(5-phosphoribosylamino)uracil reductase